MPTEPVRADSRETGVVAVIPSRMSSTRFPGKPLASETGKPMVQHVYERAAAAQSVSRVLVATSDEEIIQAVQAFQGEAVLTSPEHPNGTSRLAEVAESLPCEIMVNVQGDEPMIDPEAIDLAVKALQQDPGISMSTVACPFAEHEDLDDPNLVKVVTDQNGRALLFSRERITPDRPGAEAGESGEMRHVGLYAYRPAFLQTFAALAPTPMELSERLEQLRALEHGHGIAVARAPWAHHGIDTPEQYAAFVESYRNLNEAQEPR